MLVSVRLFAILRERAETGAIELELDESSTAGEAVEEVGRRFGLEELLSRLPVAIAVNRESVPPERRLVEGDEVALIPPVSGGADASSRPEDPNAQAVDLQVRVTGQPLSPSEVADSVRRPTAGAVVVFQGTTRDVPSLLYEAYEEMAEQQIARILSEAIGRHGLEAAAAEHRTGSVAIGEPSVVVAVSAAHREQAFEGAREVINRVKAEAAIWKKEISESGAGVWVEGATPSELE